MSIASEDGAKDDGSGGDVRILLSLSLFPSRLTYSGCARRSKREREREFIHLLAQEQTVLDCLGSMRLIAED